GRNRGRHWAVLVARNGQFYCPPMGSFPWPPTRERRRPQTHTRFVQRDDVTEACAGVRGVLRTRRCPPPGWIPVATEAVVVHPAKRLDRALRVIYFHASAHQEVHLLGYVLYALTSSPMNTVREK